MYDTAGLVTLYTVISLKYPSVPERCLNVWRPELCPLPSARLTRAVVCVQTHVYPPPYRELRTTNMKQVSVARAGFPNKINVQFSSNMRATCPAHIIYYAVPQFGE